MAGPEFNVEQGGIGDAEVARKFAQVRQLSVDDGEALFDDIPPAFTAYCCARPVAKMRAKPQPCSVPTT